MATTIELPPVTVDHEREASRMVAGWRELSGVISDGVARVYLAGFYWAGGMATPLHNAPKTQPVTVALDHVCELLAMLRDRDDMLSTAGREQASALASWAVAHGVAPSVGDRIQQVGTGRRGTVTHVDVQRNALRWQPDVGVESEGNIVNPNDPNWWVPPAEWVG